MVPRKEKDPRWQSWDECQGPRSQRQGVCALESMESRQTWGRQGHRWRSVTRREKTRVWKQSQWGVKANGRVPVVPVLDVMLLLRPTLLMKVLFSQLLIVLLRDVPQQPVLFGVGQLSFNDWPRRERKGSIFSPQLRTLLQGPSQFQSSHWIELTEPLTGTVSQPSFSLHPILFLLSPSTCWFQSIL